MGCANSLHGMPRTRTPRYYAYLLWCADGSYYSGSTADPARRLAAHRDGRASKYTRGRGPHRLAALWQCPTRRSALQLERLLKRLPHTAKGRLAAGRPLRLVLPPVRGLRARRLGRRRWP